MNTNDSYVKPMVGYRFLIVLGIGLLILFTWAFLSERKVNDEWESFKSTHACVETPIHSTYGKAYPKPGWVCNDGKIYLDPEK